MDKDELIQALAAGLPQNLAEDLVGEFLQIRQDLVTGTLGRASPGKFVETVVQILQYMESGKYDKKPRVDEYVRGLENRAAPLADGLRICASRVARSMYSLRNKRNLAHKGDVDPNIHDLRFLHGSAQWIMAELLRSVQQGKMSDSGKLIDMVEAHAGGLVEDFGHRKLVQGKLTARDEILVLLHSVYPDIMPVADIVKSMDRVHPRTVTNSLQPLWKGRLIEGDTKQGFKLTKTGYDEAIEILKRFV